MARYVDGFVLPIPKKNIKAYQKIAQKAGKIWMEHGALQYVEAVGEDFKKGPWSITFPQMVNPKRGETIVFAFIVYKSRSHRDTVNKKVMKDPRMQPGEDEVKNMPFDCQRMAYSGFEMLVDL